jgi:S-adenosylmethionine synthetase
LPRERDRPKLDILASAHASLFSVCSGGLESVLDEFLRHDPSARVACKTLPADQCVGVAGDRQYRVVAVINLREFAAAVCKARRFGLKVSEAASAGK